MNQPGRLGKWALLSLWLTLILGLSRLPFLDQPLIGEEGMFACLVQHRPPGPDYGLMARVNGVEKFARLNHPAFPYEMMRAAGRVFATPLLSLMGDVRSSRLVPLFFTFAAWLALAWRLSGGGQLWQRAAWAAALLLAPISVGSSLYLHLEAPGLLLTGLLVATAPFAAGASRWPFLLAALALGLGKQEWSIAFILSGLAAWLHARAKADRESAKTLWLTMTACVAGNLLSFGLDRDNYMGGWKLLRQVAETDLLQGGSFGSGRLAGMLVQAPFLLLIPTLLAAGLYYRLRWDGPLRSTEWWAYAFALALFLPYSVMNSGTEYRYHSPSFMAASFLFLAGPGRSLFTRRSGLVLLAVVGLSNLVILRACYLRRQSITESVGFPALKYRQFWAQAVEDSKAKACLLRMPAAVMWNRPDLDGIQETIAWKYAQPLLAGNKRPLCWVENGRLVSQ